MYPTCPPIIGKKPTPYPLAEPSFFLIHGVALWSAWCIMGQISIISNRYLKHFWRYRNAVHVLSGLFILITTLWYGFYGLWKMNSIAPDPHAKLGITVASCVSVLVVLGVVARKTLGNFTEDMKAMLFWKKFHKIFAYLFLCLAEVTVAFGIYYYNYNKCWPTNLHWLHLCSFVLPLAIFEILHQTVWLRQEVHLFPQNKEIAQLAQHNMSPEQFIQVSLSNPKRIYVILDEWVLDATDFAHEHPGGHFMLNRMNGKDISKYFHGGYNLEPTRDGWNNAHSNYARKIVNSLIIGRLTEKKENIELAKLMKDDLVDEVF